MVLYAAIRQHGAPEALEIPADHPDYAAALNPFYEDAAARLLAEIEAGRTVAVLCEGDPFFYGSFMYIFARLADRFETIVVPGVSSITAAAARVSATRFQSPSKASWPGTSRPRGRRRSSP